METFTQFTAIAAPMDRDNIDTDQIIPARFLMMPRDERYKTYVFRDLRIDSEEKKIDSFVLNYPSYQDSRIIVANQNFGCGSSREGAVFTLVDAGFRAIIAASFGDIFYNNSFNNGLLPVILPENIVAGLRQQLIDHPGAKITVDLDAQIVLAPDSSEHHFEIDPHRRYRLLNGLDAVGYTLQYEAKIEEFENQYQSDIYWH